MKKLLAVLVIIISVFSVVHASTFEDVKGQACELAVNNLKSIGIVNGLNEKEFAPKKSVTRAELSKMIVSALNIKEPGTKTFSDVNGHWGEIFIKQAAEFGILKGYSDGTFKPDNEVSYSEAIAILLRSIGFTNLDNTSGKWYENYISKMKEIKLDDGVDTFDETSYANRGDISILLWNTIKSNVNGDSLLMKNFSNYEFFNNKKITDISLENGKLVYYADDMKFYVENNIDFSNIGGIASGYIDKNSLSVIDLRIDEGKNLKKISGSTKTLKELGYDIFSCDNIFGYGAKEKSFYVEIFVNQDTNKTERVVYYDTTESHFAEQVKNGVTKISIESRHVYDPSKIVHNGQTIELKILRRETVKEIDKSAVLVHSGEIVPWTELPDNSVVREIKKDSIYTYIHEYIDAKIKSKYIYNKYLIINGKKYWFSDECIAENIETEKVGKFNESMTIKDLETIFENEEKVRLYINEFDEIVKIEFSYDIWGEAKIEEEKKKSVSADLNKIGFITNIKYFSRSKEDMVCESYAYPIPNKNSFSYSEKNESFSKGDFVYIISGDNNEKFNKITENKTINNLKIILNYSGYIEDDKLGTYNIDENADYYEVLLRKDTKNEGKYSDCVMSAIGASKLTKDSLYKSLNLVLDEDNNILRVYAIKTIEGVANYGIVKDIETNLSGDTVISNYVYLTTESRGLRKYNVISHDNYGSGDLITYSLKASTDKKKEDILTVGDVYSHKLIGNKKDLIIKEAKKGVISFTNWDDIIDIKEETFKIKGKEYYFDEYTFINAEVEKDSETNEWIFKNFNVYDKNKATIRSNDRLVIDEITRTIVIYDGYSNY